MWVGPRREEFKSSRDLRSALRRFEPDTPTPAASAENVKPGEAFVIVVVIRGRHGWEMQLQLQIHESADFGTK
ncbi:MAG: hypothetical protein ACJASX_004206 [Limisphaerales bacterium]